LAATALELEHDREQASQPTGAFDRLARFGRERIDQRIIDEGAAQHTGGVGVMLGEDQGDARPRFLLSRF